MNYGGFWIRFLAYLVDSLIISIGFFAIVALLSGMGLELISNELILFAMAVLYYAFMQASARQATFGKALVGLKVAGLGGERIGLGRALAREVAKILSALTFLIGFIIAGLTKRKQALHDFLASTTVVRAEPGHVVAALAVALVALAAPFVVVLMFGAGLVAGMIGGIAGTFTGDQKITLEISKPAAPPTPPIAKPQAVQTPAPSAAPRPVPVTAPAPAPKPLVTPVSAPVVVAQAPAPAPKKPPKPAAAAPKEPASAEPASGQSASAEAAKPEAAPPAAAPMAQQEPPKPVLVPARPMAPPSPKFNDLATAVLYGDAYAVQQLLSYGKWADKPDSTGVTPLMLAARMGDAASAEALLKAGANPNRPGPGGSTAASIARERKDTALLGLLQRYGGR